MQPSTPQELLLFSTVKILTGPAQNTWTGSGTGFGVFHDREGLQYPFLVTNKHVIRDAAFGLLTFTKEEEGRPKIGDRIPVQFDNFGAQWHGHPNPEVDVAVFPAAPLLRQLEGQGQPIYLPHLPLQLIPDENAIADLNPIEEVLFAGYPNGIWDEANLLPIVRRGTTATPISVDYNRQPAFLIDASVFPGSSGSPVMICNSGGFSTKRGFSVGTRVFFLGIVSAVLYRTETNTLQFASIPTNLVPFIQSREMIDLGLVWKARTVREAIEDFLLKHPQPVPNTAA
jgi:hypothetical protein